MSVSRPLLLGLGGLALLGVVQWVILPAFEYRADNASRAERARQRIGQERGQVVPAVPIERGGPGEKPLPVQPRQQGGRPPVPVPAH